MHSNGQSVFFKCPNLSKRQESRNEWVWREVELQWERKREWERGESEWERRDQLTKTGFPLSNIFLSSNHFVLQTPSVSILILESKNRETRCCSFCKQTTIEALKRFFNINFENSLMQKFFSQAPVFFIQMYFNGPTRLRHQSSCRQSLRSDVWRLWQRWQFYEMTKGV